MRLRRLMEMGRRARCWREDRMELPSRLILRAAKSSESAGRDQLGLASMARVRAWVPRS